jgi:hypothetical protein
MNIAYKMYKFIKYGDKKFSFIEIIGFLAFCVCFITKQLIILINRLNKINYCYIFVILN